MRERDRDNAVVHKVPKPYADASAVTPWTAEQVPDGNDTDAGHTAEDVGGGTPAVSGHPGGADAGSDASSGDGGRRVSHGGQGRGGGGADVDQAGDRDGGADEAVPLDGNDTNRGRDDAVAATAFAAFIDLPGPRQPIGEDPPSTANQPVLRPTVTELRLSAFKSHRGAVFPLGPVTVFAGEAGTGKSSVLEALVLLSRLAAGDELATAVRECVGGGPGACAPDSSRPDDQGRRGFHLGCTVDGPVGEVRLDLAVQTEPELRVVGERLTGFGLPLLTTALRDPSRSSVQAAWHTAGAVPVTRAPLPDSRLATALLPLRVAGTTTGQRMVISAAEQMLIGLRAVFPVAPVPAAMRAPSLPSDGMLRPACDNLSAVLNRTAGECRIRHGVLVDAFRAVTVGPLDGIVVTGRELPAPDLDPTTQERPPRLPPRGRPPARSTGANGTRTARPACASTAHPPREGVMAALDRGSLGLTPIDRLGDSELRFLALALVLLTGPGVLEMDQSIELPPALRAMTVVADGLDIGLDPTQTAALLTVARRAVEHGHVRVVATAHDPAAVTADGITVVPLRRPVTSGT